jgi:hypothetical protein
VLKNKEIVAEGEKLLKSFKAVDYDLQAQLKAIAAFEAKAVSRLGQRAACEVLWEGGGGTGGAARVVSRGERAGVALSRAA